jgi:hypothetical protein
MARIWDRTPAIGPTNSGDFTFGVDFQPAVPITVQGLLWYAVASTGPATVNVLLLDATGVTVLASATNVAVSGSNEWVSAPFDTPYAASAATTYVAVVQMSDEYRYDIDAMPRTSADGHVEATQGRFEGGHVQLPTGTWTGWHGFDVEYELSGASLERWGIAL